MRLSLVSLTRWEQVTVFRLRTGHNRLNNHLYFKLHIGHTEQCPCGTGSQTTEHLLQFCPTYEPLRKGIWPDHSPVARKLYGSLGDWSFHLTKEKKKKMKKKEEEDAMSLIKNVTEVKSGVTVSTSAFLLRACHQC